MSYRELREQLIASKIRRNLTSSTPMALSSPGLSRCDPYPGGRPQSHPFLRHFLRLDDMSQMSLTPLNIQQLKGADLDADADYHTLLDIGKRQTKARSEASLPDPVTGWSSPRTTSC